MTHNTQNQPDTQVEYVEFVYRLYPDGRRERFARHRVLDEHGLSVPGDRRPVGVEGRQVAALLEQGLAEQATQRRVVIDERAEQRRRDRRRGR